MSFRTVRILGFGTILLMVFLISILSYVSLSSSAQKIETIVTVEETKLRKWHLLSEAIDSSKNSLYDYSMGSTDLIAPVSLLIEKALREAEEVKMLTTHEHDLANIEHLVKKMKVYRQAVHSYGLEIAEGYRGGTSAEEAERIAMAAAENITQMSQAALDDITSRIGINNKSILKTTNISLRILEFALIFSVSFTVMVAFFMGRALAKPVHELVEATGHIAKGDLTREIEVKSHDEIGELSSSFNSMVRDLREQRAQLVEKDYVESIITSMSDALIVIAPDGRIKTVNSTTCELSGYKEEELIGENIALLCTEEGNLFFKEGKSVSIARDEQLTNHEVNFKARDGRVIPVLFSSSVIRDKNGNATNIVCTAKDITERKRTEEILAYRAEELASSNAELQRMVYVASHDLQEPLRMVTSYVQLLEKRYRDRLDSEANEFIGFAVDGTLRMRELIKDLLILSRVGTRGKTFETTDCETILKQVLTSLQPVIRENKAEVTHDSLPKVMADDVQLAQLFQNLIGNAIKFHGNNLPRVHISARKENNYWVFSVHDNGIGIEQKDADKVFQIFKRLHSRDEYSSGGIGLAVCQKIIERHKGKIWVESEQGKGSVFCFTLPI